jgi:hypothetical protein
MRTSGLTLRVVWTSAVQDEPARCECVWFVISGECAAQTGVDVRARTRARIAVGLIILRRVIEKNRW